MKFTIIMQSYLLPYPGAARNRVDKFHRAIQSIFLQDYPDWELEVIADGCMKTVEICKEYSDTRVTCRLIEKQPTPFNTARNLGIVNAKGDYILYLDTDDCLQKGYLSGIKKALEENDLPDWAWFNDLVVNPIKGKPMFKERFSFIGVKGRCGTSNVVHKRSLYVMWENTTYLHDWYFIRGLISASKNYCKLAIDDKYMVCHIPKSYEV